MKLLFPERILQLRKEAGFSQADLAMRLQTTQRKVSYWETGKTEPDMHDLWQIADLFSVSIDFLLGRTDY